MPEEPPQSLPPEIPPEKPTEPSVLSATLRMISNVWDNSAVGAMVNTAAWLAPYIPDIVANMDPPKTFDELTEGVGTTKLGYEDHHIVEQTSAARDGYPSSMINSEENVVKVPRLKHREITAWYGQSNDLFGGLTPRQFLSGRSWDERYAIGIGRLIEAGVLKP